MNKHNPTSVNKSHNNNNEKVLKFLNNPKLVELFTRLDCKILHIKNEGNKLPVGFVENVNNQLDTLDRNRKFSFFKNGITDIIPYRNITIQQVYQVVSQHYLKNKTLQIRSTAKTDKSFYQKLKSKLPYVTFSGTFSKRSNNALIEHSCYYCLDLDHIDDPVALKKKIVSIQDPYFETELVFISPTGNGIKWVVYLPANQFEHTENFNGLRNYIEIKYKLKIDNTPDVARACFLCYDPDCFLAEWR